MKLRSIGALTTGHFLIDLCQGMVPALVPFLIQDFELTYFAAGSLVFAVSAMSSLTQPFFGIWADRISLPALLPASILLAGGSFCLAAQSPTYAGMFLGMALSGLGVAAFHPEAARTAHQLAGHRVGLGMSLFTVGGSAGFAVAPVLTTSLVLAMGRPGLLLLLLPCLMTAVVVRIMVHRPPPVSLPTDGEVRADNIAPDSWLGFTMLSVVTLCRSVVFFGLNTFICLYWMDHLGYSLEAGESALAYFLGLGVAGTVLGGWLADRLSARAVLRIGFVLAAISLPLVGWADHGWIRLGALGVLAVASFLPASVVVVLGQAYLPNRIGMASGVTLGLAVSVGGMTTPLLGYLADHYGVAAVFQVIEGVILVAALQSMFLVAPPRKAYADA